MKFIDIVCAALFARVKPVSTRANPACMNITRKPVKSVQTKLMPTRFWPATLASSAASGSFAAFAATSVTGLPSLSLAARVMSVVGFPFLSTYAGPPSTMLTTSAAAPVAVPAGSPFAAVAHPASRNAESATSASKAGRDMRCDGFDNISTPFPVSFCVLRDRSARYVSIRAPFGYIDSEAHGHHRTGSGDPHPGDARDRGGTQRGTHGGGNARRARARGPHWTVVPRALAAREHHGRADRAGHRERRGRRDVDLARPVRLRGERSLCC